MTDKRRLEKILAWGIVKQVLPSEEAFKERLLTKTARLYIETDPTSSTLHLSHAKNYQLLEEFRQLGHEAIVLFGDFTKLIGNPTVVLAAKVSALGAVINQWWIAIEKRLLKRRDVARRLVFEITGTAGLSPSEATIFTNRMRRLGCRIAVDEFGVGFPTIRRSLALTPDVLKVDGSFVRRKDRSERDRRILANVTGLARAISSLVVVEGIETETQRKFLERLGTAWIQGNCVGRPSVVRSWLFPNRQVEAVHRFRDATLAQFTWAVA